MDEAENEQIEVFSESDGDNGMESVPPVEAQTSVEGRDGVITPRVGMDFKDLKEMFEFYKKYAFAIGFPVKKRNSKRGDDGELRYVTFTCSREGRKISNSSSSLRPQPTVQLGCKARISASADIHGEWRINKVHLEHNHETSPSKSRLYRCNRELSSHVKRKLEINDLAGIPLHKSFNSAVVEAGGYDKLSCVEKDCRNYVEQIRRLRLAEGDAASIQAYFSKMQAKCAGFYFNMDLDDESRLRSVFWADNRCRKAYKEFGDVVTFDTTYLTNKYDMPFAPFVGVNHHGQSMLFGCGLVSSEDTDSFVWLFSTWLQCMQGHAPNGIITDQDRAMQNAIQIVFPNTRHRWCLWHILKKLPEKFGYHDEKSSIFAAIHVLVYDCQFVEEFESGWAEMIRKYSLENNYWLSGLYDNRSRWVPCFLKTTFWAGMSTTQRSESMNAFFDGYVHSKTSLKQFVEQYERALRCKVESEFQADFKSFSQMVPCATQYEMEQQFQSVYTIAKFKEAQNEFVGKVYCDVMSTSESSIFTTYEVCEDIMIEGRRKRVKFYLSFEREHCDISCSCHLFEFRGILCRHAIAVLIRNEVTTLPARYILRRWRRDVSRAHTRVAVNYDGMISTPEQMRYDELCRVFAEVADLVADNEALSHKIMDWLQSQRAELSLTRNSCTGSNVLSRPPVHVSEHCSEALNTARMNVRDPNVSRRKGAPRKLRKKGPLESSNKKSKGGSTSSRENRPTSRRSSLQNNVVEEQIVVQTPVSYQPMPLPLSQNSVATPFSSNMVYTSQGQQMTYDYPNV